MTSLLAQPVPSWRADLMDRTRRFRASLTGRNSYLPAGWLIFLCLELLCLATLVLNYRSAGGARADAQEAALFDSVGPWEPLTVINPKKVAFLLETRTSNLLVPLLLQYISVTPPDWLFIFMGSPGATTFMESIPSIKRHIDSGKLQMQYLPSNVSINSQETLSRFYTNPWTYSHLLPEAETLFVFQNDAMVCANSEKNINEFGQYSWVGAPWRDAGDGGNGGLSLRNATAMRWVTSIDERIPGTEPEDVWMVHKFHQYGIGNLAPHDVELEFSAETAWYAHPMGYHTGGGGEWLNFHLWGTPQKRNDIYDWCPEVKMVLNMDVTEFLPGHCGERWKGV